MTGFDDYLTGGSSCERGWSQLQKANGKIRKNGNRGRLVRVAKNWKPGAAQATAGCKRDGFRVPLLFFYLSKLPPLQNETPPIDFCRLLFIGKAFFSGLKIGPLIFSINSLGKN